MYYGKYGTDESVYVSHARCCHGLRQHVNNSWADDVDVGSRSGATRSVIPEAERNGHRDQRSCRPRFQNNICLMFAFVSSAYTLRFYKKSSLHEN